MFQPKKYRRVMCHNTEEWCEIWRGTYLCFERWHDELGEFLPNTWMPQNLQFNELLLNNVYSVWAKSNRGVIHNYITSFEGKMNCGFINDMRNWVNFRGVKKITEELCAMTLKVDAIFKEKVAVGLKYDITNLVSFHGSSRKSKNLHFDILLLSKHIKFQLKSTEELSLVILKSYSNFEEKLTFYLKNNMWNLINFNARSRKSRNCTLMSYFCLKYAIFVLKKHRGVV